MLTVSYFHISRDIKIGIKFNFWTHIYRIEMITLTQRLNNYIFNDPLVVPGIKE